MSARRFLVHAVCLAGLLGLGFQVVYAVVVLWIATVGTQLIPSRAPYENLTILRDGTPVIVTNTPAEYRSRSARTLDGEPVELDKLKSQAASCSLAGRQLPPRFRPAWPKRIHSYSDGREPAVYWYFVHTGERKGSGYFVGYDSKLKVRIGYIGRTGFLPEKPPPDECFPVHGRRINDGEHATSPQNNYYYSISAGEPGYYQGGDSPREPIKGWMVHLVSENRILEIDLQERSVRTVLESDQIVSINLVDRLLRGDPTEDPQALFDRREYLAVRLEDRVLVLDPHGAERQTYLLPEGIRNRGFEFYQTADKTAIVVLRPWPAWSPVDLYWLRDSEGTVRSESVALQGRPRTVVISDRTVLLTGPRGVEDPRIVSALYGLVSPVPVVCATVTAVAVPIAYLRSDKAESYSDALGKSVFDTWPGLVISLVLSAAAVWLCLRRQRQYAAPWTRTWAVFVFVFGIPGLLGYLFLRTWPPREECPKCRETAPRDRESCFACGTDFPEPAPKGVEVFA